MSFKLLAKTLRPKGQIYILPSDGNVLKAYNSKDKKKKPMSILRKYNIYIYTYNKKYKQYIIDCSRVTSKSKEYIFLFKKGNKLWLMWHKQKGKLIFNGKNPIVKAVNKYYREQCSEKPYMSSGIFETIGKFAPSKIRYVTKEQKRYVEENYKKQINKIVKKAIIKFKEEDRYEDREEGEDTVIDYVIKKLAKKGSYDMIAYALKNRIGTSYDNNKVILKFGTDSLHLASYAVKKKDMKLLKILLQYSVIEWYDEDKVEKHAERYYAYTMEHHEVYTPLLTAVQTNNIKAVKILLKDSRIKATEYKNQAIFYAIKYGYIDIVKLLLLKKNVFYRSYGYEDGFYMAINQNNMALFKLLLHSDNADINDPNIFISINELFKSHPIYLDVIFKYFKDRKETKKLVSAILGYIEEQYSMYGGQVHTDILFFINLWTKNISKQIPHNLQMNNVLKALHNARRLHLI